MATVIVKSDRDQSILMSERVLPDHLDDEHSSVQFLERLAWAISDADGERRQSRQRERRQADVSRRRQGNLPGVERVRSLLS